MTRLCTALLLAVAAHTAAATGNLAAVGKIAVLAGKDNSPDGYQACSTVGSIVSSCADALPTNADDEQVVSCYCCGSGTTNLASVYGNCESYIATSASTYSFDYTIASEVQSICVDARRDGLTCGGGGGATATGTPARTRTTASGGVSFTDAVQTFGGGGGGLAGSPPPACTSFESVYLSCSRKLGDIETVHDDTLASCMCYSHGTYTTAVDDYISKCGVWAKTGIPTDYPTYVELETFCEDYPPETSAASTPSSSEAQVTSSPASLTSSTSTTQGTRRTVTVTPSETATPTPNAAVQNRQPAMVIVVLAVVVPFVV
ncbi:hypothetical protein SPI_07408 [Niveomyces insectorum RCEF 264]|uniref:Uncharacterized protein n=1 Tax=Niveomyces insectorum RCEF 264 TaxID=1081102 RepID=A0A167PU20_9HYPO|nr:hypothetical protein SPI_07408 [Niveomyces insectorum RCEF 264]